MSHNLAAFLQKRALLHDEKRVYSSISRTWIKQDCERITRAWFLGAILSFEELFSISRKYSLVGRVEKIIFIPDTKNCSFFLRKKCNNFFSRTVR